MPGRSLRTIAGGKKSWSKIQFFSRLWFKSSKKKGILMSYFCYKNITPNVNTEKNPGKLEIVQNNVSQKLKHVHDSSPTEDER